MDRPLRLLLVEDDAVDAMALRRALARAAVDVVLTHVEDGQAALDALATTRFDAALVDVRLPRMSGLELLARLRADPDRAPPAAFAYSTSDDDADVRAAYAAGAAGYFVKPTDPDDTPPFLHALHAWWRAVTVPEEP